MVAGPSFSSGAPPLTMVNKLPATTSNQTHRGTDGMHLGEIPARPAVTRMSSATSPIAGQDGVMVSSTDIASTARSLVPAHSAWIGDGPGTGRISINGRR
ncbi:Uncharacterised protein [Mycobacteroides abscessus subsp. abscessus]|nr:Uncharacterised protein [Mycobacteroides abscessus subsp. abscessus]